MSLHDDSPSDMDDMDDTELTDAQLDGLLTGTSTPAGYEGVADAFAAMRQLTARQPDVTVSTPLAEFVSSADRTGDASEADITLEPVPASASSTPPRRYRMARTIASSTAAKLAVGGALTLAGVTGVHAAGLVDVPLLPDESDPVEVVVLGDDAEAADAAPADEPATEPAADPATQPSDPAEPAPDGEPAQSFSIHLGNGGVELRAGDVSISIQMDVVDGVASIEVQAEGVSPECEAALESLEDLTDMSSLEGTADEINAACGEELGRLFLEPGGLGFDHELFGSGGFGMFFDEDFDPERLEEFLRDWKPEHLEQFLDGFDPEQFGGPGFGMFFDESFDPEKLEEFLRDLPELDPGAFRDGNGFGFFFDQLDPEQLEQLEGFLGGFDPETLFGESGGLHEFLEQLPRLETGDIDLGDLEGLLEDFDAGELDRWLEDLDGLFGDLEAPFGEPSAPFDPAEEIGA